MRVGVTGNATVLWQPVKNNARAMKKAMNNPREKCIIIFNG
jgi:hypothetical protein